MAITAEVFHIYFHKMDPTLTTSETINFAGWHKQQHKGIDAKKMLHSKPSSKLNVERSFIELFYSISFYVIWLKNKTKQKTPAQQQMKTSSIRTSIHNVITILQNPQEAGKRLASLNETYFWM